MIDEAANVIAKRLLDSYAAVYYVSTPAQQERVIADAAKLVREELERLIVALNAPEHE